ncbi:MAG: radical SAM/SPASM family putative metalloenzyme maturase [Desulfobulbus sp.]|nr:radical SAM/SPASM family putative metalloenzyme maturase [Desulfobulbus sp.]
MSALSTPAVTSVDFPHKIYLETTTRCNLRCRMCVKYAQGSCIEEGDLDMALFQRLLPSLSQTRFLVLNGIGEPLLHSQLTTMIALARQVMPQKGVIGFQSNGLLLSKQKAEELLQAGLDTICLSIDSLEPVQGGEHQRSPVERAIDYLRQAASGRKRPFSIGLEVVLQRQTVHQLPLIIDWAHERGVDYIIASHLFSYDGQMDEESVFTPCSTEAIELFAKWSQKAKAQGLDLGKLQSIHLRFNKSAQDRQLLALGAAMQQEARELNINLHFPNLLKHTGSVQTDIERIWEQSLDRAEQRGIRLTLPPLQAPASGDRACPFMEEQALFIATNGDVSPCHFLWHTYPCMVNQTSVQVQARSFGNIKKDTLEQIWQDACYTAFRQEASGSDYAPCWSCSSGPCPDLVNPNLLDIHDCYGTHVPCGHCMWSLGWTRCL